MTRVAIVGGTAELRALLADTLAANREFVIVGLAASADQIAAPVDLVLVARTPAARVRIQDRIVGAVLTAREREVLTLLADGLGNKQIAARLGISANTVKTHLELLFEKLGVSTRAQAVAAGVRLGLLLL